MIRYIILATLLYFIYVWIRKKIYPQSFSAASNEKIRKDPYTILNINSSATPEEIKKAYYDALAKNHPDKVAHLSDEIQETAKKNTADINWAYQQLK